MATWDRGVRLRIVLTLIGGRVGQACRGRVIGLAGRLLGSWDGPLLSGDFC